MACRRWGGDAAGVDLWAGRNVEFPEHHPDAAEYAAEALLLNGRTDAAVELLLKHRQYVMALDFETARFRFGEAAALVRRAEARASNELPRLRARYARTRSEARRVGRGR